MAEVSLIVPVYKVEAFLDRCVKSVLSQSFSDLELILVDDGSPDDCPAMCDQWAAKDSRVHVIHQINGGLSAARNTGIDWVMANSDSEWIAFLDSDDWIHRCFVERLLNAARSAGAQLSICGYERVAEEKEDLILPEPQPLVLMPEEAYVTFYSGCMTACCKLIRRELMTQLRFPLGKLHEDAFITHEILFSAEKTAILDEKLYYYYFNPESITRKEWTPKRLEELEGHHVRMQYLKEHGLEQAQKAELEVIISTLYEHAFTLGTSNTEKVWLQKLRRDLRNNLKLARKQGLFQFGKDNRWLYLMAYMGNPVWLVLQKIRGVVMDWKQK